MSRWIVLAISLFVASFAYAARLDVLVVVNENSVDSPKVGEYYAEKREIDSSRVVRVRSPDQFIVNWQEFQSLRDQILRFGFCPTVSLEVRPAACDNLALPIYTAESVSALTANTPIRYVVLTRGVPTRMVVAGSTLGYPDEPTSVDNYLRFWLARYLTSDVPLGFSARADALAIGSQTDWRSRIRSVRPAQDLEYIIGRIDGVDLESALALVDRTLDAENKGPFGKMYTNQMQWYPWRYAFGLFDESRSECADDSQAAHYLNHPESSSQGKTPADCQVKVVKSLGTFINESMPGLAGSRQPLVDEALIYFGHLDGQSAQGGFSTLLNWRKNASCTTTLCRDAADSAACRAASTDPFRELDTRCVGVVPGFLGYNFTSYSLANFGSWPTGWATATTLQSAVPRIDDTRGADDAVSAWFGSANEIAAPLCYPYENGILGSGATVSCRAINQISTIQSLPVSGIDPAVPSILQLGFKTIGEGLAAPTTFSAVLQYVFKVPSSGTCSSGTTPQPATSPTQCIYRSSNSVAIGNGANWQSHSFSIVPPAVPGSAGVESLNLYFTSSSYQGRIGLDSVSVTNQTGNELVRNGSFNDGHRQVSTGDFAANFLSRMGGIAFWGSLSHHQSGGHSFGSGPLRALAFLTRGLPLGDAVWLGEKQNSGILYGDPLYSPTQIRFRSLPGGDSRFVAKTQFLAHVEYGEEEGERHVHVSACRGSGSYEDANVASALKCDREGSWRSVSGGDQDVTSSAISLWLSPDESAFPEYGDYVLRLQVSKADSMTGTVQTLNDFYPVKYGYSDEELARYSIAGRVLSAAGDPIPNVSVKVIGSDGVTKQTITSFDGQFVVKVDNGEYAISAEGDTCQLFLAGGATSPVTVAGANVNLEYRCISNVGGAISGRVTDTSGQPLTGIEVSAALVGGGTRRTFPQTGTTGFYQIDGLSPGTYSVSATNTMYSDWSFSTRQVVVTADAAAVADLTGEHGSGTVRGYVRDGAGTPYENIYLVGTSKEGQVEFDALTNANGYFAVGGLQGSEYSIEFFHDDTDAVDGMPAAVVTALRDAPSPITVVIERQQNRHSIMGYVRAANRNAMSGAVMTLTKLDGSESTVITSSNGFYRFDQLPDATYKVRASYSSQSSPRTVVINGASAIEVDFIL